MIRRKYARPARHASPTHRPPPFAAELLERRTLLSAFSTSSLPPQGAEVVSIKATDAVASEASMKSATLTVSRTGVTAMPLTVNLVTQGPAVEGTDYTFSSNVMPVAGADPSVHALTIPAGVSSVDVTVSPVADAASDGVYYNFSTLTVNLQSADPQAMTNPAADFADVRIYDGDDPQPPSGGYSFGLVDVLGGASSIIEPQATVTDSNRNVYVVGTFSGSVNLNPAGAAANYSSPTTASAFVAKYSPLGALLWSKVYSGASDAWASSVALDNNGNVIVGGRFLGSVDFNPSGPSDILTTPATQDGNFVIKLTADGSFVWAQQIGGIVAANHGVSSDPTSLPDRTAVAADANGNIYVGGDFAGTASLPGTQQTLTSQGGVDMFIVKLSPAGSLTWADEFGGPADDMLNSLAADGAGQVYAAGSFGGTVNFGATPLTSAGVSAFALKLASNGAVDWAGAIGGGPNDSAEGNAILADSSGNVYLAGDFAGTVDFDPGPGVVSRTGTGGAVFVLQLTANGAFGWVQTPTTSGVYGSIAWGLAQDSRGSLYVTGFFSGTLSAGPAGVLGASGPYDAFVLKLSQNTGGPTWATKVDGMDGDLGTGIAVDSTGNLYVSGNFSDLGGGGTANFDPFNHTQEQSAGGSTAGFLWKLNGPSVVNNPPTVATPASANPNPVTGTTTALSVLGADASGESSLTYTWAATGAPPAAVAFSGNGTNAAKNTTATFTTTGTYNFQVTITDSGGLSTTSNVTVTVNQTLTSISVMPATVTLSANGTQPFAATGYDQYGHALTNQPSFTWSLVAGGIGTIDSSGLYTAPAASGRATVEATSGLVSGMANVTVPPAVTAASFDYANQPPDVSITFDGDVSASLSAATLEVQNLNTAAMAAAANVAYNHATNTATFSFAGSLPDGNYRATLPATGVADSVGDHMLADYTLNFFVLAGDANRDRSVGFDDLLIVARHYGQAGTFADGDLNGDGKIGFDDLIIVARSYGHSVPPPAAGALSPLWPSLSDGPLLLPYRRRH